MSKFLTDFADYAREIGADIYSVGILEGDSCEPERIFVNETNNCSNIYSVAKVFTTTAVGLCVDRGLMRIDERVCDILGELCPSGIDPRWRNVTVDMALRHHVGLPGGFLDIDVGDPTRFGRDYLTHMLREPLVGDPSERAIYTDAAFYLLSRLVEIRAGRNLDDLLRDEIYVPLGFREAAFSRCPEGHAMGATGLYLRADDVAKLGGLYLRGGEWNGRRILSREWVATVLERGYELKPICGGRRGAYGKGGMHGQMLLVVTESSRVVAWTAYDRDGKSGELTRFAVEY